MKQKLQKIIAEVAGFEHPNVEFTSDSQFGDYTTNIAMVMAKVLKRNPNELAEEIVEKLNKNAGLSAVARAKVEHGFINFWLKKDVLVDNLIQIDEAKEKYGTSETNKGKLAIIEYSSPNIAKPFGVGHLRSTVVGDAIANLVEATGYKVMRDNHLGDWGTQFGKVICAIKKWGNEEEIEKSDNPVQTLVNLYVKFHDASKDDPTLDDEARAWFKKLEDGDSEARRLWQKCVDWSWIEFDKIYKLLNIKFDENFCNGRGLGESFFETRMASVIKELNEKELLKVGTDGAKLVFFEGEKYPPLMILKKDGSTLYATRDLATDKYRLEKHNPDLIINEVGTEQSLYFKQLYEIEKILGWYKDGKRVHVGHGLYLLDGKKMSTRAGKTVKLDEVLVEAIGRAKKLGKENANDESTARSVGIGAIKYFDLSHQPQSNISFDWDSMFAMDGNSAPYIQYTVARCNSVIQKASSFKGQALQASDLGSINTEMLDNQELTVLRLLSRFNEVVEQSASTYSPNTLCNYLYELAQKYNGFYNQNKIIGSDSEKFRLALTSGVGQVLKNGLNLLGIQAPERM